MAQSLLKIFSFIEIPTLRVKAVPMCNCIAIENGLRLLVMQYRIRQIWRKGS